MKSLLFGEVELMETWETIHHSNKVRVRSLLFGKVELMETPIFSQIIL